MTERQLLYWQFAEMFGQVARAKLFWAVQMPAIFGGYLADVPE